MPLVRWRTFKLNLASTIWWWELGCNEEWITLSRTIFGWGMNHTIQDHIWLSNEPNYPGPYLAEEWTTLSTTIFDWHVKIKSRQDEASSNMWVDFVNYLNKSKMRNHDLKLCPTSCGLIAFILVFRFSIKVSNIYGRILILGRSKFEIQLKVFNKRLIFFHVLSRRPI